MPRTTGQPMGLPLAVRVSLACALCLLAVPGQALQAAQAVQAAPATGAMAPRAIVGTVVDADTGEPLRNVEVRVGDQPPVDTGADGRFRVEVPGTGDVVLRASTVGYALARRTLSPTEAAADVLVPLVRGTGAYTERVTVTADGSGRATTGSVVRTLESRQLQDLGSVLADDPLRAAQSLPGVAWNDDFRAEVSIRGQGPEHIGFSIDDVPTPWLVHTVLGRGNQGGSISLLNADVLDRLTVAPGVRSQRLGDRTGAWLETTIREGSRDAVGVRGALSLAGVSTVVEGPFGRRRRGSWLVSARQSYLDWLLARLSEPGEQPPVFGFTDTQSKLAVDLTARHRLQVTLLGGRSRVDDQDGGGPNSLAQGYVRTGLATVGVQSTLAPAVLLAQRAWTTVQHFENIGEFGQELSSGSGRDSGYRADVSWSPAASTLVEVGGSVSRRSDAHVFRQFVSSAQGTQAVPTLISTLSGRATSGAAYGQATWSGFTRASVMAGARVTRFGHTGQSAASPWASAAWSIGRGVRLRGGAGVARQAPSIEHVSGLNGRGDASALRSRHEELGLEYAHGAWRAEAQVFDRRDEDVFRQTNAETRIVGGRVVRGTLTGLFENALDGRSRGVELTLERRSVQGCGGWVSFTYGRTRYSDRLTGETFWGDWDQRHAMNGYAFCQVSPRTRLSAKVRGGSGFPIPAYLRDTGSQTWQLSDVRNGARLPAYSRVDLTLSRAFVRTTQRWTLFVEAMNAFGHANYRSNSGSIRLPSGLATDFTEELLPFTPVAGLLVEF